MAKTSPVPRFVRLANVLTTTLLRAGFKLNGFGTPMYLITIRGRKSGQPRTTPIAVVERDGKRYLFTPYGAVDWVRNLRAAGEASLTRARRTEVVRALELPSSEAGPLLKALIETGNPISHYFGVAPDASRTEFERAAISHPVFMLRSAPVPVSEKKQHTQPAQ